MPSPYPGMDPYLEGHLWPDVHSALAAKIRQLLAPQVRPRYVVRLAVYVMQDLAPEGEIGIMYPDVEVLSAHKLAEVALRYDVAGSPPLTPPIVAPLMGPIAVRIPELEIRDAATARLVTAIELLSPVNKRGAGLDSYRQQRRRLLEAGVHLVEIDLIRRGLRPFSHPQIPPSPYLVTLVRSHAAQIEAWPVRLDEPLPTIPIPLQPPDADAVLALQDALAAVYEEAGYDLSLDYSQAPPPPGLAGAGAG